MGIAGAHGRAGEALAAAYLELCGCEIRARNVRLAGVEIDLVVQEGRTQVLVEVKTRTRSDYGGAALAVDAAQRARLLRAAGALDASRPKRIDVVAIETRADGAVLTHYRNALSDA
ncbi:MAG: YraN family protein [Candidatus Eiseniibacteriota bacterium]